MRPLVVLVAFAWLAVPCRAQTAPPTLDPQPKTVALQRAAPSEEEDDEAVSSCVRRLSAASPVSLHAVTNIGNIRVAVFYGSSTLVQEMDNLAFLLNHGDADEGFEWKAENGSSSYLLHRARGMQGKDQARIAEDASDVFRKARLLRQSAQKSTRDANGPLMMVYPRLSDGDFNALLQGTVLPVTAPDVLGVALRSTHTVATKSAEATSAPALLQNPPDKLLLDQVVADIALTQDKQLPWVRCLTLNVSGPQGNLRDIFPFDPFSGPRDAPGKREARSVLEEAVSPQVTVKEEAWKPEAVSATHASEQDSPLQIGRILGAISKAAKVSIYCEVSPFNRDHPWEWTDPHLTTLSGPLNTILNQVAAQFGYNIVHHGDAYFLWSNRYPYDRASVLPAEQYDAWCRALADGKPLSLDQVCAMSRLRDDQLGLLARTRLAFVARGDSSEMLKTWQIIRFVDSLGPDLRRQAFTNEGVRVDSLGRMGQAQVHNFCLRDVPPNARIWLKEQATEDGPKEARSIILSIGDAARTYFGNEIRLHPSAL